MQSVGTRASITHPGNPDITVITYLPAQLGHLAIHPHTSALHHLPAQNGYGQQLRCTGGQLRASGVPYKPQGVSLPTPEAEGHTARTRGVPPCHAHAWGRRGPSPVRKWQAGSAPGPSSALRRGAALTLSFFPSAPYGGCEPPSLRGQPLCVPPPKHTHTPGRRLPPLPAPLQRPPRGRARLHQHGREQRQQHQQQQ